jgi:DNA-binding NarL/FixJ family response regulator
LEREAPLKCLITPDLSNLPRPDQLRDTSERGLILVDCQGRSSEELLVELQSWHEYNLSGYKLVFFNLTQGLEIEKELALKGVRGLFYEQEPFERFVKGVLTVINGELWLSRKTMTDCILEKADEENPSSRSSSVITRREREILILLAVGHTNEEIADKLCISRNTLRTHLYNVYKKINASNRLQASLWAAKNL